jgi:hypothetical protein
MPRLSAVAALMLVCPILAPAATAQVNHISRSSSLTASPITVLPGPDGDSTSVIDSSADLAINGLMSYSDSFGRSFLATYDATQDATYKSTGVRGALRQDAVTTLISAGFPFANLFSVDIFNDMTTSFRVDQTTTLRLTLEYTGTVTLSSAADQVDFRVNGPFAALFIMPLDIPGGTYTDAVYTEDFTFEPDTTYTLVASARAFSGSGEGLVESRLRFTLGPVCVADLTNDGTVDSGDLAQFIASFLISDESADVTFDGTVDSGDLALFISLFLSGC